MSPFDRIIPNPGKPSAQRPSRQKHWPKPRRRSPALLPWLFIVGVIAATLLPWRQWIHGPAWFSSNPSADSQAARDAELVWRTAGSSSVRHSVEVLRTIDGDTFEARVHLSPGIEPTTRVRLRGVDAPERKGACKEELEMAEAAGVALRRLLGEGGVTIYNIGPDKYHGRVVADAATRRTDSVAAALLASGHARSYRGGHRDSWCSG